MHAFAFLLESEHYPRYMAADVRESAPRSGDRIVIGSEVFTIERAAQTPAPEGAVARYRRDNVGRWRAVGIVRKR